MNAKIRVPLYLISLIMLLAIVVTACQQTAQVEPTAAAVEPTAAAVEPTAAQVEPTATQAEPTAPAVEATEAESEKPITLSVWWISSSPEYADQISAIMKQYETQNPNITIEVTYFPYSDYVTAMGPALEAGDPPDLAFSDPLPPTSAQLHRRRTCDGFNRRGRGKGLAGSPHARDAGLLSASA